MLDSLFCDSAYMGGQVMGLLKQRMVGVLLVCLAVAFGGCNDESEQRIDALEVTIGVLQKHIDDLVDDLASGNKQLIAGNHETIDRLKHLLRMSNKAEEYQEQYGVVVQQITERLTLAENVIDALRQVPDASIDATYIKLGQLSDLEFAEFKKLAKKATKGDLTPGENNRFRVLGGIAVSKFTDQQDIKRAKLRGVDDLLNGL